MRVVMIGPFGLSPRGTMSVRAVPLARALVAREHEVTILLPPVQDPGNAGRSWVDQGVRIENLPLPLNVPVWSHFWLSYGLARRALVLRPDVVHLFKPKAYAGLAHWFLRVLAPRLPLILDTDDWEGAGGWNDLNPYPALLKRFFARQECWGLTHADAVTVASRALETLTWAHGGDPDRVFYLPNGVDVGGVAPRRLSTSGRPTLLLYTRFFEFELERLWRVVVRVREALPEVRLWVVGKGFFGEEQRLLELAREANWSVTEHLPPSPDADLVYAGWVAFDELPAHFARADIALYPFDDTLVNRAKCPVKLLDLMAAGIPVVGEAVGQIVETLGFRATVGVPVRRSAPAGVLVPPGDEDAFVDAVLTLLEDEERRKKMGTQAAFVVRKYLSWDHLAKITEQAYHYAL